MAGCSVVLRHQRDCRVVGVVAIGMSIRLAVITAVIALLAAAAASGAARNGPIAYTVGNNDEEPFGIRLIRPDGMGARQVLGPTDQFDGASGPRWSPDGRRLL